MSFYSKIKIDKSVKYQLIRGVTGVAGIKLASTIISMVIGMLWARILGPEDYGFYTYILSVIVLIGLPTQGGLPTLVMREVAKYKYDYNWSKLRGLLLTSNISVVLFTSIASALAFFYIEYYVESNARSAAFMWSLLLVPLIAFANVRVATLKGFKKVVQGSLPEQIVKPLILLLMLSYTYFYSIDLSVVGAVKYTILAIFGSFFFGTCLLIKTIPEEVKSAKPFFDLKPWVDSVIPLTIFSSLSIANSQVGAVVLGFLGLDDQNGYYRVAFQGASLLATTMMLIESVIAPYIVKFRKENDFAKIQKVSSSSASISFLLALPLAITFFLWGEHFIALLFGEDYISSYSVLVVLAIGQMLRMIFGSAGLILNMMGKELYVAISAMIAFIANLLFCFIFAETYGAVGVAYSSLISMSIWSASLAIYCYRVLGINTTIFGVVDAKN